MLLYVEIFMKPGKGPYFAIPCNEIFFTPANGERQEIGGGVTTFKEIGLITLRSVSDISFYADDIEKICVGNIKSRTMVIFSPIEEDETN